MTEAKQSMTGSDFTRMKMYLLEEPNEFNPMWYYLAAITAEVARGHSKHPRSVKIIDRILKFKFKREKVISADVKFDPDEAEHQVKMSKITWFQRLGMGMFGSQKGKIRTRKPPKRRETK